MQSFIIMAAVRDALQLKAAPHAALLFSNRTIAALAATIRALSAQDVPNLPACTAHTWPGSTRPLSKNQQQMWMLRNLSGSAAYNLPLILALHGSFSPQILQQALDMVAARHEVLRMHYQEGDGGVTGIAVPAVPGVFPLVCSRAEGAVAATTALQEEISKPFDLAAASPVRALLLSINSSKHVLCLTVHHIALDGWSSTLLWGELSTAYTALVAGQVPQLPPLPVQYSDYAAWQQEVLASDHAAQWRSYWREALLGAPALLQLPCDRPRPAEPTYAGATTTADLPAELETALYNVAIKLGVNIQAVLLGTLQVIHFDWLPAFVSFAGCCTAHCLSFNKQLCKVLTYTLHDMFLLHT
jgi:hypothetical protein